MAKKTRVSRKRTGSRAVSDIAKILRSEEVAEHTARIIEDKVFEIKAMVYLSFAVNLILLFLVLGVLLKLMGF